ncbi:hypothetical protein QJS04_geneDACA015789 [Acorus gramineus]|uniref:Rubredoxin-like domain-containing protein n=1 Tax=Acorus gramineus TaxID=55184 RepID=A0AAV9BLW7_ACOGR|nr:hypothetical protein QJS04_geneDACA015789 [Acorus gramineus]
MASATARLIFAFHRHHHKKPFKPISPTTPIKLTQTSISPLRPVSSSSSPPPSVDLSEDGGVVGPQESGPPPPPPREEEPGIDPRRLEERFVVLNTGIHECRSCGYLYNEAAGDPTYPVPPGMGFGQLPEDWRCPTCGAATSFFVSKSVEIAGFAENQKFGLGGNTLTSGQKAVLIYGSLLLSFALFLSGYFLQ